MAATISAMPRKLPFRRPRSGTRLPLVLYSRSNCSLCDQMRALIEDSGYQQAVDLQLVDIDSDPELAQRYGTRIPVLTIAAREVLEGRVGLSELRQTLSQALR